MAAAKRGGSVPETVQSDRGRMPSRARARTRTRGGMANTRERTTASVAPPEDAATRRSAGVQEQAPRLDRLLEATRGIGVSRDARQIAEVLRAEIAHLLVGIDCRIDICMGKAKIFKRLPRVLAGQKAGPGRPELVTPDSFVETALQERRLTCTDVGDEPARLVIPLLSREEPWGYVDVRARRLRLPDEDEAALLQVLANCAATALENLFLRRSVDNQGMTDPVTGFYSRSYFYERLCSETVRARRYGEPLSAIMFEVDDFEEFVEERGRAAGTYLLRAVSRLLRGSMRQKVDLAYRCTGARFALLLPNTPCSTSGAALVAERLRGILEATEFRNEDDELFGRFTMSAGVAGFPGQCDDADELASAVEEALAAAKRTGKNRVKIYGR